MKILQLLVASLLLPVLAACGGGGGGGGAAVQGGISGTATKGPMSLAAIKAFAINGGVMGAQIATATTDANGNFTMATGSYAGAMMLQVSGGTYTDEATGTLVTMAPDDVMTAVIPTIAAGATISGIQVTPVTAMAQSMAQHMTGGMTDTNINAANAAMGNYLSVSDILRIKPINPLVAGSGPGATTDAQNYGMALAAVSQFALDQGMTSSPSAMVTALMQDASDGVMDGKMTGGSVVIMGGGGSATGNPLPAPAGPNGLGLAMSHFMGSPHNLSAINSNTTATLMTMMNHLADGQVLGAMLGGTAFNGPMSKATVTAFAIDGGAKGAQIASVATDGQGNFTLPLGSYSGPVMLQMSAGTYTDEATGTTMTMGASDVMSAVLPTVSSGASVTGIWVTPVTSMAQTRAAAMSGGMTDANIAAANTAMGNYFSVTTGILTTPPIDTLMPGSGTAAGVTQDMKNYGLSVAAMSQSAKTLNMAVSSAFVTAMMSDAADGVMNGMTGSSPITMPMSGMMGGMGNMAATAGTSGLATAMTSFITNPAANQSGLTTTNMAALISKLNTASGQI